MSMNRCSRCKQFDLADEEASLCEQCDDEMTAEEEQYK